MNRAKAILTLADLTEDSDICPACRQRRRRTAARGALMVAEVYWHGLRAPEFTALEARLLGMLLQFGRVSYDALILLLPGDTSGAHALKVHAHNLRRNCGPLPGQVTIRTLREQGYEIEVREQGLDGLSEAP